MAAAEGDEEEEIGEAGEGSYRRIKGGQDEVDGKDKRWREKRGGEKGEKANVNNSMSTVIEEKNSRKKK